MRIALTLLCISTFFFVTAQGSAQERDACKISQVADNFIIPEFMPPKWRPFGDAQEWSFSSFRPILVQEHNKSRVVIIYSEGNKDEIITGILNRIELSNEISFYTLSDQRGRVHVFDQDSESKVRIFRKENSHDQFFVQHGELEPIHPIRSFNEKKLLDFVCADFKSFDADPNFKKAKKLLERKISPRKTREFYDKIARRCRGSVTANAASWVAWSTSVWIRKQGYENLVLDHGSNFYMLLPIMGVVYHCFRKSIPSEMIPLGLSLAGGIAVNVLEEVNTRQDGADIKSEPSTEWTDFISGNAAVVSFAAYAIAFERKYKFSFAKACKK
ncbi:MAG: hypothetical protein AB1540_00165 [Bdellovibrionota bacterium]